MSPRTICLLAALIAAGGAWIDAAPGWLAIFPLLTLALVDSILFLGGYDSRCDCEECREGGE